MISAAMALMTLAACNERIVEQDPEVVEPLTLDIRVTDDATKVSGTTAEDEINDLQIFVFNTSGTLEAYESTSSSSVSLLCLPGTKNVIALVNAPDLSDVSSYTELKEKSSVLADNGVGDLVMEGEKSISISASSELTIPVSRIVGRIAITKITNDMELEYHRDMTFTLVSAYLINVAGNKKYLTASSPTLWYNQMKNNSEQPSLLWESLSNTVVKPSESYTGTHYFYAYPNLTTDDHNNGTWLARHTRLVVEAKLGTTTYYYPVTLPEVRQNTAYEITLTVTRPGSTSPDQPLELHAAKFSVSVVDWIDGGDINETI